MANKKAEILTMDGQVVSPITLATNVLLDDGRTAQDLLDSRDESMFSPTITTSSSISKAGQGDNVDFSENVIDGAYGSCVLKGKTLVNYNAEGNDRNEYVCMPSVEGSNLTVNDTVEGKVKSAILKGQTLVNLLKFDELDSKINKVGDTITVTNGTDTSAWYGGRIYLTKSIERNKKYIAVWDNLEWTHTHVNGKMGVIQVLTTNVSTNRDLKIEQTVNDDRNYMIFSCTDENGDLSKVRIAVLATSWTTGETNNLTTIKGLKVLEYQEGMENWDIPYFEGMQSVKMPVLTTSNGFEIFKTGTTLDEFNYNLVNLNNGCISIPHSHVAYIETKKEYTLLPNQSYVVRVVEVSNYNNSNYSIRLKIGDRQLRGVLEPLLIEELSKNSYYDIVYTNTTGESITGVIRVDSYFGDYKIDKIYIGEEPYKSNILTVNEEVELRGIGDVQDTLDCLTGELIENTGIYTLTGDESFSFIERTDNFTSYGFVLPDYKKPKVGNSVDFICNLFKGGYAWGSNNAECIGYGALWSKIVIRIEKSKLSTDTINGFSEFVRNNTITVVYPKTKSIKTVDLSDNHVYSYKDVTHYDCSSAEGSLVPTLSIEEGVKYQAIIKPSTKYSIVFNRTLASNSLTVDLGGATASVVSTTTVGKNIVQITTPSTLSHNYVIFKGLGNVIKDVQVIEGDVVGDEPYFEGMIDVKNPIVINCNSPIQFGKGGRL